MRVLVASVSGKRISPPATPGYEFIRRDIHAVKSLDDPILHTVILFTEPG